MILYLIDLVASAYTTGKIEILSDGSPIRPVIHIKDLCKAFIAGIEAPKNLVSGKSFNIGIENGNYSVNELAKAAQQVVPESELVFYINTVILELTKYLLIRYLLNLRIL